MIKSLATPLELQILGLTDLNYSKDNLSHLTLQQVPCSHKYEKFASNQ